MNEAAFFVTQTVIAAGPLITIQLLASPKHRIRRWGYVTGLAAQPAWFYLAYATGSWGLGVANCIYVIGYLRGIVAHFR